MDDIAQLTARLEAVQMLRRAHETLARRYASEEAALRGKLRQLLITQETPI